MSGLPEEVADAVVALRSGGVVGIPTDTVYGLGVDPRLAGATERLFAVKGRPETLALPVLVADPTAAAELAELDEAARLVIGRFWPGPLTLVLPRRGGVELDLGGDPTTVGLRCPGREVARALLAETGPLAVSSANRHGEAPATTAEMVRSTFGRAVAVVVDGGVCDGVPSTVARLDGGRATVLREGPVRLAELEEAMRSGGEAHPRKSPPL